MDTKINMEKFNGLFWEKVSISTTQYATLRKSVYYRLPLKEDGLIDYDKAYSNFRDNDSDDNFLNDVIDAITNKKFAPSYKAFKKCLINGKLFAIISARGHEPQTIRRAIEYFIDTQLNREEKNLMKKNLLFYYELFNKDSKEPNTLIDNYLSLCEYIGVTSNYFINYVLSKTEINPEDIELSKKIAVTSFSKRCINFAERLENYNVKIKIGFSDDDKNNLKIISECFMNELKIEYPNVEFSIFDTSENSDGSKNYNEFVI
jgi:hypothetical protein